MSVRWAWKKFLVPKTQDTSMGSSPLWGGKNPQFLGKQGILRPPEDGVGVPWVQLFKEYLLVRWFLQENAPGFGFLIPEEHPGKGRAGKGGPSPGVLLCKMKSCSWGNSMRDQPKPTDPEWIFNLHRFALGMRLPKIPRAKESSKIPLDLPEEGFSLLHPCSWMGVLHSQGDLPYGS